MAKIFYFWIELRKKENSTRKKGFAEFFLEIALLLCNNLCDKTGKLFILR